jgi:hypothetical protein
MINRKNNLLTKRINAMKHTLSLFLLLACGSLYAGDIDLDQWNDIKHVVCKNMGLSWGIGFNKQYPKPSEAGVRELAEQLDFDEDDMLGDRWTKDNPQRLIVSVERERIYGLTPGECTDIICAVRQEMRESKKD